MCLWQVVIGMDVAASEFYDSKDKTYDLNFKEEVIKISIILVSSVNLFVELTGLNSMDMLSAEQ